MITACVLIPYLTLYNQMEHTPRILTFFQIQISMKKIVMEIFTQYLLEGTLTLDQIAQEKN